MWLASITHTGHTGGTAVTLPAVTFAAKELANRVDHSPDNLPPLVRNRVDGIDTEAGESITVDYDRADCTAPVRIVPDANTRRCFPVYWAAPQDANPRLDWFHKYVVHAITDSDGMGGASDRLTEYRYLTPPAWHYDDNEVVKPKYRTYGQYRGLRQGAGPDRLRPGVPDTDRDDLLPRDARRSLPGGRSRSAAGDRLPRAWRTRRR